MSQGALFDVGPGAVPQPPASPVYSVNDYRPPQAIAALLALCFPRGATVADVTWGHGGLWRNAQPAIRSDRRVLPGAHLVADFRALPLGSGAVDVVVFDPPFQPRTRRQQLGKYAERFTTGGCRTTKEIRALVVAGALEARRVARSGIIVKCQDYINARQPAWMSFWLYEALGEPFEAMHCVNGRKSSTPPGRGRRASGVTTPATTSGRPAEELGGEGYQGIFPVWGREGVHRAFRWPIRDAPGVSGGVRA